MKECAFVNRESRLASLCRSVSREFEPQNFDEFQLSTRFVISDTSDEIQIEIERCVIIPVIEPPRREDHFGNIRK